ncbi:hypothetical protein EVJ58_g6518 [Rhodofomes roseus]|uniref:Cytochrome b5 heme-binding domain-containing protein n=1 Tax=Rhodofomes roseus TaxID=34475 RepID=A0A4Y9YBM0_9APHY|nr:hypothetical protein EVJ58_g6518 [Rhodofomes roseus]
MIFRTDLRPGAADVSDLKKDALVQWQHRWYFPLALASGCIVPLLFCGLLWGDWSGGFCFAVALRMTACHHSTFCINSIAHYLGDATYDDKLSPRDHLLSALLTMGEGYHNFHHQFPMDYRNAFRWYQYDPTKWFIAVCNVLGLATNLRKFPSNEIEKGILSMKLKDLKTIQDSLKWPLRPEELPIVAWDTFQKEAHGRALLLISGYIHDVSSFIDDHPGGAELLAQNTGKDVTAAFFGGMYEHSNAAHNLLAMYRVGILAGGVERLGHPSLPPAQALYIVNGASK